MARCWGISKAARAELQTLLLCMWRPVLGLMYNRATLNLRRKQTLLKLVANSAAGGSAQRPLGRYLYDTEDISAPRLS